MTYFIVFIITGLLLIAIEIIVPGGIIGVIGGMFLLGSAFVCFNLFGAKTAVYYSVGLIFFVLLYVMGCLHWARYLPFREKLFLYTKKDDIKFVHTGLQQLVGKEGIAYTMLRPAGKILVDGKRYTAQTRGVFINKSDAIEVIEIENDHIIVKAKTIGG